MKKYYSSERLKEITYTNEIQQDLCIYDRKNQVKLMTLIHDMDLEINSLQQRIGKAVEFLNEPQFELDNIPCNYENEIEKLRNILRGDE